MNKNKILIIENSESSYDKITGVIPGCNFLPIRDDFDKTKKIIQTNLSDACNHIKELITQNYSDLKCIVCDLKLGNIEGKDIIDYIRNQLSITDYPTFNKFIPIVIYTGYATNNHPEEALKAGGNVALAKSVSKNYLKCVVEKQIKDFSLLCDEFILKKKYEIGITFCGSDTREFVRKVANELVIEFSKKKVFFDEFHQKELDGLCGNEVLEKIYTQQSKYIVLVMSKNYQKNYWTGNVEWPAIKDKLIPNRKDTIIPILYDKAKIIGIDFKKDIAIKVNQSPPKQNLTEIDVAKRIIDKIFNK
jgi:CheY-like chemotaxis protein